VEGPAYVRLRSLRGGLGQVAPAFRAEVRLPAGGGPGRDPPVRLHPGLRCRARAARRSRAPHHGYGGKSGSSGAAARGHGSEPSSPLAVRGVAGPRAARRSRHFHPVRRPRGAPDREPAARDGAAHADGGRLHGGHGTPPRPLRRHASSPGGRLPRHDRVAARHRGAHVLDGTAPHPPVLGAAGLGAGRRLRGLGRRRGRGRALLALACARARILPGGRARAGYAVGRARRPPRGLRAHGARQGGG